MIDYNRSSVATLVSSILGQTSSSQSSPINDPHMNFQNSQKGLNDHKGPENINYTTLKYKEIFYVLNTKKRSVMMDRMTALL